MKLRSGHFHFWLAPFLAGVWLLFLVSPALVVDAASENQKTQVEPADPYVSPTSGLGSWIWEEKTMDNQTCLLWNTFEIPEGGKVTKARLVMTADNEFTLYLDGRELGHGAEWRELFVFDLTPLLTPGRHVLAVHCFNGAFAAGMLFGLRVDLTSGPSIEVKSDKSWRIVPEGVRRWEKRTEAHSDWPAATVIAPFGGSPWSAPPEAVIMMPPLQPIKVFFWQTGWFQVSLACVCGLAILFCLQLMAQLALHQTERRLLQSERARIAREIHDDIGSRMTQLVLQGEVAQSGLPAGSESQVQVGQICEEARSLLSTMDEILWAMNPRRDTLRDFTVYVCNYAQEFLKPTQIECRFEVDSVMSAANLDLPLRRSLLMAIKETLNNAVKHSEATELKLKIHWQAERLFVIVEDNGKGFDSKATKSDRNGLRNMMQRMDELSGSCRVTSEPGKGCRVEFSIPVKQPRRSLWAWLGKAKHYSGPPPELRNSRTKESPQNYDPTKF